MEQGNIKNLIFDLGGVIIDLDFQASYREFSDLSGLPITEIIRRTKGMMFFEDYEKGLISSDDFRIQVQQLLEFSATDQAIDNAWCAMLGGIPAAKLSLLRSLKQKFRTFALSNTNEIHVRKFNEIVEKSLGDTRLLHDHFDHVYYSHQMKMRKPDPEIYQAVLGEQSLNAEETLFIDDNLENIQSAGSLKINTFHLRESDQLITFFNGS